jgi:hypothetical protein
VKRVYRAPGMERPRVKRRIPGGLRRDAVGLELEVSGS